jgi:starvation-inducible outer membrane lipoprotein
VAVGCALAAMLAGCSSSPKWLENRAVCTVDGKEAHTISKWGPIGIGSKLADSDAKVICK